MNEIATLDRKQSAREAEREQAIARALREHGLPDNLVSLTNEDPTAPFDFVDELAALAAANPPVGERLRERFRAAGTRLGALDKLMNTNGGAGQTERRSQSGELIAIAKCGCMLFHDNEQAFADIETDGHRETWPVRARGLRLWLQYRYFQEHDGAPNAEAMQTAIGSIEAMARFNGEQVAAGRRVAADERCAYLDLGNAIWQAIEITTKGWRVVDRPPVRFIRARTTRELPAPDRSGASITILRRYLNLASDNDFVLATAWLLAAMQSSGPYPVLVLTGEQGSAKSTCARLLRALVDPQEAPLRSVPRDERDLFIAARNAHVLAFDNLSAVPAWLSDALCRISTGGGFATRELYSNDEEVVIDAMRPIILNGIDEMVARGDLADRAIFLTLSAIPEAERKPESELLADFERDRPRILGALLDAFACGLKQLPDVRLARLPRMADFAKWVVACEPAVFEAGAFMRAYTGNRAEAISAVIDASPVASAIRDLIRSRPAPWEGTASELYAELSRIAGQRATKAMGWPANAQALSRRLNRVKSALRPAKIVIDNRRYAKRLIRISAHPDNPREIATNVTRLDAMDAIDATSHPKTASARENGGTQAALPSQSPGTPTAGDAYRRARGSE